MVNSPVSRPPHFISRRLANKPLVDVANKIGMRTDVARGCNDGDQAIPFPCQSSTEDDVMMTIGVSQDPSNDRKRDWTQEIAKRRDNIKELRKRKVTLEKATKRTRKTATSLSLLISPAIDRHPKPVVDLEFLSTLHASIVWRLWHVATMPPDDFASERLLVTRLHLILMRNGYQNIPVPPVVASSKSHFLKATVSQHMIARDRPGIQSLAQLVAKLMIRHRNRHRPLRKGCQPSPSSSGHHRPYSPSPLASAV